MFLGGLAGDHRPHVGEHLLILVRLAEEGARARGNERGGLCSRISRLTFIWRQEKMMLIHSLSPRILHNYLQTNLDTRSISLITITLCYSLKVQTCGRVVGIWSTNLAAFHRFMASEFIDVCAVAGCGRCLALIFPQPQSTGS